ncbi:MAG TPA: hydroxyacid dehydrogenase [Burkholderiales bacterium]|nr:hydroxyacid dehydrogenase [Burkholderiales bacterium]
MKVVIAEFMDESAVSALLRRFDVRYDPSLFERRDDLLAGLADVDALIVRNHTQVNAELLARAPRLRVVGRLGVGLDNIDVAACAARGIEVIPATGANALAVAEYVVCTAMLLLRGAYLSTADVAAGKWPRGRLGEGRETSGRTLGVVGFGGIGRLVAKLAQGLGMKVLANDAAITAADAVWRESGVAYRGLDDLLAESDAVTLHVPLTQTTRHLISAGRLARMKRGAVLINTARGGVIDEDALAESLAGGHLAGAALDVFEIEPLPAGSPLAGAPNLVLTPHIAGVTREANARVSGMIAEKVAAALARS